MELITISTQQLYFGPFTLREDNLLKNNFYLCKHYEQGLRSSILLVSKLESLLTDTLSTSGLVIISSDML